MTKLSIIFLIFRIRVELVLSGALTAGLLLLPGGLSWTIWQTYVLQALLTKVSITYFESL